MPAERGSETDIERPLGQRAYDSLKTMILSGQVRPGERLGERELARLIQVSRTPLREALGRLEGDGLVVNRPGQGYFALDFDPRDVAEIYQYRELLEVHAVRAAARAISAAGAAELRGIVRQLALLERQPRPTAGELREEVEVGLRIHEVIAEEAGNRFVRDALLQTYDRLRLLTWIDVLWFDKWSVTRKEHRDLVDAVCAGDERRAARIAARHVHRSREGALWVINAQHKERSHAGARVRERRTS
jgi:DNA-binding GntR family transcriptional regulator